MLKRSFTVSYIMLLLLLPVFHLVACDDGDITTADGSGPGHDSSMPADSTSASGEGTAPNLDSMTMSDSGTIPTDGAGPPEKDSGTSPPGYGKICSANSECAANELCVKLASDSYPKTSPPPPKGICLKKCSNPNAPCSSSASHFYPCISASTWDLGAVTVCAIACSTSLGGTTKTYPCPTGTYCTRSFGGMMKICTPYQ